MLRYSHFAPLTEPKVSLHNSQHHSTGPYPGLYKENRLKFLPNAIRIIYTKFQRHVATSAFPVNIALYATKVKQI